MLDQTIIKCWIKGEFPIVTDGLPYGGSWNAILKKRSLSPSWWGILQLLSPQHYSNQALVSALKKCHFEMYAEGPTLPLWKPTLHAKRQPKLSIFYFCTNRSPLVVPGYCIKDKMVEGTIKTLNVFSSEVILLSSQEDVCWLTHFIS